MLGFFSLIFFVSATLFLWQNASTFNSPDENANAMFANQLAVNTMLWIDEPLNLKLDGLLHPRSVIAIGGRLLPVSFLGIPVIYGLIGKGIGVPLVGIVTPFLMVAAAFAWRSLMERLFQSRAIAFLSALAVLFHPGIWYYSARLFMHNVPFTACLILATFFASRLLPRSNYQLPITNYLASGLFLSLAIWFRTSELFWILPCAVGLTIFFRKQLGLANILLLFFVTALFLSPLPFLNRELYGASFTTGYTYSEPTTSDIQSSTDSQLLVTSYQLPISNLQFSAISQHIQSYAFSLFPWMTVAAALGLLIILGRLKHHERGRQAYLVVTLTITAWLFMFYGSWSFTDNPDPTLVTIGTSYVRYWLPVFVLWSPFVAQFLVWFSDRMRTSFTRRTSIALFALLLVGLNVRPVFSADDGLLRIRDGLAISAEKRERVLTLTEENAILVVDRADKFLWPHRRVIQPLRSETTYVAMPDLAAQAPLYYFGIPLPEWDLNYLNNEKLVLLGLQIELVEEIQDEALYAITPVSP